VKIATTKAQRKLFFNLRSAKKNLGWLNNEEAQALARDLGVEVEEVRRMEGRLAAADVAFDAHPDDDDETASFAPAHYLEDRRHDPATQLEDADWETDNHERLGNALEGLDDRSRVILQRRWLDDDKATLHELAAHYGVSAERIRQLEQVALKKIRSSMLA
jgi:RNA polymerase sigma-32 factor